MFLLQHPLEPLSCSVTLGHMMAHANFRGQRHTRSTHPCATHARMYSRSVHTQGGVYTYAHMHMLCVHVYVCLYSVYSSWGCLRTHVYSAWVCVCPYNVCGCTCDVCTYMHTCTLYMHVMCVYDRYMHTQAHVCICLCPYIHTDAHGAWMSVQTCTHAHTYVCVCVCLEVHRQTLFSQGREPRGSPDTAVLRASEDLSFPDAEVPYVTFGLP